VANMQQQALEDEELRWLPVYVRCGEDPLENIKEAVAEALTEAGLAAPQPDARLSDYLQEAIATSERVVVLLVDEFEEYFVKLGDRMRTEVARQLAEALGTETENLRILLSIREDYLGQVYDLQEYLPEVMHNAYRLRKLTQEQAERAAVKPAASFGVHVEQGLVEQVLRDLDRDGGIEPAQLQIVMDRLYQSLTGHRHRRIVLHTYEQFDGARRILDDYLDHALGQFPALERRTARHILKNMVASSELTTPLSVERIAAEVGLTEEPVERILARLVDLRLVRRLGRRRQRAYELVHEYVVDKIEQWMSEREIEVKDVQDLLTRELNNYQKFGLLMPEGALRILADYGNELSISPAELELVIRSAAHRNQDAEYWLERADELEERLEPTVKALLADEQAHVRQVGLQAVNRHPSGEYLPELTNLLGDRDGEIREMAEEQLRRLDRELVDMLGRGDEEERRLAAYALGKIDSRRGLRPLAQALEDGDEGMREEVAEALAEIDAPGTTTLLLRRLSNGADAPWAVAYALGRIAHEPEAVAEIERAHRNQSDSPQIAFALALAHEHRREHDAALELLDRAEGLTTTKAGREAIAEARAQVESQRERAAAGGDDWPVFHRDVRRTGANSQEVAPPLEVKWRFQTRGPVVASPVIGAGLVCVGSRDRYLYALDSSSGALHWELRTDDRVEAAPALTADAVYATSGDGRIYAAGLHDGRELWTHDTGAPSRCSPAAHSGVVVAGNQQGRLLGVDARNGELRWETQAEDEISAAPTILEGRLVVGSWDGNLYAVDPQTGEEIWRANAEGPIAAAASAAEGCLYCGSDAEAVFAFSADTGERLWRRPVGGQVRSCPAVTEHLVVAGCLDGKVYALNRADGEVVWSTETEDEVLCSPAVAGDTVYIGSKDGTLYAMSLADGGVLWRYPTSYAVYSSPAIAEQMVILGMEYYNVVAFAPEQAKVRGAS
jgi:outer membrane protein assembly factor BamB